MKRGKIARAFDHLDDELITGAMQNEKNEAYQKGGTNMTGKNIWKKWTALAAAFVIMLGAIIVIASSLGTKDATIAFDVNPSIEMKINGKEEIVEIKALNDDAVKVIGDMDFEGVKLDVALNALIGSMLSHGYLTTEQNSILISVDTKSSRNSEKLQQSISESVAALLQNSSIEASVITQSYKNDEIKTEDGASKAKAHLVEKIVAAGIKNADGVAYTKSQLFKMSINELKLMLESKGVAVNGLEYMGTASDGKYIGAEKALEIALAKAGFTKDEVSKIKIELDFEDDIRRMVYELEFVKGEYEYEYDILADITENGKIIDEEIDFADDDDDDFFYSDGKDEPIPDGCISKERAIEIALSSAGLSLDDVLEIECEFEKEFTGRLVYEVDFETATHEYEYKINAQTEEVIRAHKHRD